MQKYKIGDVVKLIYPFTMCDNIVVCKGDIIDIIQYDFPDGIVFTYIVEFRIGGQTEVTSSFIMKKL